MNTTTPRPTPETDALAVICYGEGGIESSCGFRAVPIENCRQFERERDEARIHFRRTIDELADEQQAHGLTKGKLTECQMEMSAMRKVVAAAEKCRHWHDCSYNPETGETEGVVISANSFWALRNALAKLQPFIKP